MSPLPLLLLLLLSLALLPALIISDDAATSSAKPDADPGKEAAGGNHKLDCVKDIGVAPAESLRRVIKPYYQLFVIDLSVPPDTFHKIRSLFVRAVCLYARTNPDVLVGSLTLINKEKYILTPRYDDIREFIGLWTEPDDKLLGGIAKFRQSTPLSHCQRAELMGYAMGAIDRKRKKGNPFRMLIVNDLLPDDRINDACDQNFEFGKALLMHNVSLDNLDSYSLDEINIKTNGDHESGKRMTKDPVFTLGYLEDHNAFMNGMSNYIESLARPETWNNTRLRNALMADLEMREAEKQLLLQQQEEEEKAEPTSIEIVTQRAADSTTVLPEEAATVPPAAVTPTPTTTTEEPDERGEKKALPIGVVPMSQRAGGPSSTGVHHRQRSTTVRPLLHNSSTTVTGNATTAPPPIQTLPAKTPWWEWVLILLAVLALLLLLFCLFCCWWEKRKLVRKCKLGPGVSTPSVGSSGTLSAQTTPLIGVTTTARTANNSSSSSGRSSRRPLKLTKSYVASSDRSAASDVAGGGQQLAAHLADPYSPVKYMSTPVPMASEAELTHTEHVAPPTADEALRKHVVTPLERVPELHLDEYNL